MGDVFVGATLWPYADRSKGRFAGVAFRVMAPTGSKKAQGFAPSSDKWGAEQTLNGARVTDRLNNDSIGIAAGTFMSKNTHILGSVSRDLDVHQGPRVTVYHLRLGYIF